jgi:hypothetical protein
MFSRPPLWPSWQSSWLQIHRSGFDSRHYQSFLLVAGLERGPLSLVSTTEELLERKSSGSGLESREYGSKDPSRWPRCTLYPQNLALTSPTSGGRSVGIVRSRTQATELFLYSACVKHLTLVYLRCYLINTPFCMSEVSISVHAGVNLFVSLTFHLIDYVTHVCALTAPA